jgi:hypothetical protein
MKIRNAFLFLITFLICTSLFSGCDGWIENSAEMKQAPETRAISLDLVRTNIETTDYSAIVHVLMGRVKGNSVLRRLGGGYVNHFYRARVLETIKGPRYDTITFSVMAESDIDPILPDHPVIVSLCGRGREAMYVPDNGYELPATASLMAAARNLARQPKKLTGKKSVCSE